MSDEWVKLNVGGVVYHTTRTTLMKDENSMIYRMFSQNGEFMAPSRMDENGCYLIDRWESLCDKKCNSWQSWFKERSVLRADSELPAHGTDSLRTESQRLRNPRGSNFLWHPGDDRQAPTDHRILREERGQCAVDAAGRGQSFDSDVMQKWTAVPGKTPTTV